MQNNQRKEEKSVTKEGRREGREGGEKEKRSGKEGENGEGGCAAAKGRGEGTVREKEGVS